MLNKKKPIAQLIALAATAMLLVSCAAETPETEQPVAPEQSELETSDSADEAQSSPSVSDNSVSNSDDDDGKYVFDATRSQLATAIEAPYKSKNGKARWEGDTIILALDGDATADMAGHSECRVISHFVEENETIAIEFPNGTIDCAEYLDLD